MGDIVEFPSGLKVPKSVEEQNTELAHECVSIAIHLFDLMEDELLNLGNPLCDRMNFTDPESPEARDIYVITNLISSMLIRYNGLPHTLHPYMNDLYDIILQQTGD